MLPLAQSLASSFTVFVPDLPGCGHSQRPPAPLGISELADALARLARRSRARASRSWLRTRWAARSSPSSPCAGRSASGLSCSSDRRWIRSGARRRERCWPGCARPGASRRGSSRSRPATKPRSGSELCGRPLRSAIADRIEERLPQIDQPAVVVRGGATSSSDRAGRSRPRRFYRRAASSSSPVNPTPRTTPGPISSRPSSATSSERKSSRQDASSRGISHIGTCPQCRRTRRERGRTRCHSAAIWGGSSLSLSPQTSSVGALNGRQLDGQVAVGGKERAAQQTERTGTQRVADDRRQPPPQVEERRDQPRGATEHGRAVRNSRRRDERKPPDALGLRRRRLGRDQPTERMADQIGTLEPGGLEPAREPRCQLFGGQSTPELRQLGDVHPVTLRQRLEHRPPPAPRTREPVDEDERASPRRRRDTRSASRRRRAPEPPRASVCQPRAERILSACG